MTSTEGSKLHVNESFQCFIPLQSLHVITDHICVLVLKFKYRQTYFGIITAINDIISDSMQIKHYIDTLIEKH